MAQYLDSAGLQTVANIIKDKYSPSGKLKITTGGYDITTGEPVDIMDSFGNTAPGFRTEKFTLNRYIDTAKIIDIFDIQSQIHLLAWDKNTGSYVGTGTLFPSNYIIIGGTYGDGSGCFNFISSPNGFAYDSSGINPKWWLEYEYAIVFQNPRTIDNVALNLDNKYLQLISDIPCSLSDIDVIIENVFNSESAINANSIDISESDGIGSFE